MGLFIGFGLFVLISVFVFNSELFESRDENGYLNESFFGVIGKFVVVGITMYICVRIGMMFG